MQKWQISKWKRFVFSLFLRNRIAIFLGIFNILQSFQHVMTLTKCSTLQKTIRQIRKKNSQEKFSRKMEEEEVSIPALQKIETKISSRVPVEQKNVSIEIVVPSVIEISHDIDHRCPWVFCEFDIVTSYGHLTLL